MDCLKVTTVTKTLSPYKYMWTSPSYMCSDPQRPALDLEKKNNRASHVIKLFQKKQNKSTCIDKSVQHGVVLVSTITWVGLPPSCERKLDKQEEMDGWNTINNHYKHQFDVLDRVLGFLIKISCLI